MNKIKTIVVGLSVVVLLLSIAGCKSFENYFIEDQPSEPFTEMTVLEFSNKVNRSIMPIHSRGIDHLTHFNDIKNGIVQPSEEVELLNETLEVLGEQIDELALLKEPESAAEGKANLSKALNSYKESIEAYKKGLIEGKGIAELEVLLERMRNKLSSVKNNAGVFQR